MTIIPGSWELVSLVCKLFLYTGAASIAGGSLCLWQFSDGSRQLLEKNFAYILGGSFLGFQGVLLNYLVQVGLVNDRGIGGMFDWSMISLLMGTQHGEMTLFRLSAFVIALLASLYYLKKLSNITRPPSEKFYINVFRVFTPALFLLAYSFRIGGHVSVLSLFSQIAIFLHFLAFSFWIGSLYPLWSLSFSKDLQTVKNCLERFGRLAMWVVGGLVVAGLILLLEFFSAPTQLLQSAYGIAILIKLMLALCILGIAAINRYRLVPLIIADGNAKRIAKSIRIEGLIALLIMMLTAYFSTIIGPPET